MGDCKKHITSGLLSPQPRPLERRVFPKKNPFVEATRRQSKSVDSNGDEDGTLVEELSLILARPAVLVGQKALSPSFVNRQRPPTRQKVNPIIHDEMFQELDSSGSTCTSCLEDP